MTAKRNDCPAQPCLGPEPNNHVDLSGFNPEGIFLPSQLTQRGKR